MSVLYIRGKDGSFIPVPTVAAEQAVDSELSTASTNPVQNRAIAEAVERLSEEKADRFTVGEGLQMDGDVLGVVPEREYELIGTYTLEEDVKSFHCNLPPLKRMIAEIETQPNTDGKIAGNLYVYGNDEDGILTYAYLAGFINGANPAYTTLEMYIDNGQCFSLWQPTTTTATTAATPLRSVKSVSETAIISRFYIAVTTLMKAGTIITIKGVRANA